MTGLFTSRITGLVSVVVTAYNREEYILETLDNIKNQTYKNIEVIIVDDCSVDHTESVVQEWRRNNQDAFQDFIYVKLPRNRSEEWASNIAFCITAGEFIMLQHSDDLSHERRVERQVGFFSDHSETACVGTEFRTFENEADTAAVLDTSQETGYYGNHTWLCFDREQIEANYKANLHCVCCGTLMFRARIFEEIMGYRKTPGRMNDIVFLKQIILRDYIIDNIPCPLYYYRIHEGQKSTLMQEQYYLDSRMYQVKGMTSVILPVCKNSRYLLDALESILQQTYENIEIILVDDLPGNTQETEIRDFYSEYKRSHPECMVRELIYFKLPRRVGYPWIYNIGAYLALGEYVILHGANGVSERNKIEKQVEFLKNNYLYSVIGTNFEPGDGQIRYDDDIESSYLQDYMPCINMNTVMLRTDIINTTGGLNQSTVGREDFEFIYRLIKDNNKVQNIRDVLYRVKEKEQDL